MNEPAPAPITPPKITVYNPLGCGVDIDDADGSTTIQFFFPQEVVQINLGPKAAGQLKDKLPSGSGIVPVRGLIHP